MINLLMKNLPLRMSDDEYNELKEKAQRANLPLSRYIVLQALGKLKEN